MDASRNARKCKPLLHFTESLKRNFVIFLYAVAALLNTTFYLMVSPVPSLHQFNILLRANVLPYKSV